MIRIAEDMILVESRHPSSGRAAVLEDDGISAWLYLTEQHSKRPIADAWVFNRIEAPPVSKIKSHRDGPPPAAESFAGDDACCAAPKGHDWALAWSGDGESVAVTQDGTPLAFIVAARKPGYSRHLCKEGPWGRPWSAELYEEVFGPGR